MTDLTPGPGIGLGTSGNDDPETCAATVAQALKLGYRHIDTAQMYDNEAAVGEGIRRADVDREAIVVATKIHPDNLAPDDARRTAHESLDRLGLDRVDLLYVHWPTRAYEPEATLPVFDDLRAAGLTREVGVSNFTPALLAEARELLDSPIAAHQVECHPLLPQAELRADAREYEIPLVGYSPLGRGRILDHPTIRAVADEHGYSPAAVCLAWGLERGVTPIPKATGDHVRENLAATEIDLPAAALDRLDGIDDRRRVIDPEEAAWNRG